MSRLLVAAGGKWDPALRDLAPEIELRRTDDMGDPSAIDYALVWMPPEGLLASLPNLKVIFSAAAGVDHILRDPSLPRHLPIVRMSDPYQGAMMAEYAIYAVLHFHRFFDVVARSEAEHRWDEQPVIYTPSKTVGVLGLGAIGQEVARRFALLGFSVRGWGRTPRMIEGLATHHGPAGLAEMLPLCDYVVCALPLTPETKGLIGADFLSRMRAGSALVNIGRGGHVVDDDLIAAIDSGHLRGAFLDVTSPEPLPAAHPFWSHPRIRITPHMAGELHPPTAARSVIANIRRFEAGEPLSNVYDGDRGY
ncbi:MAG: glyoxylate/hydroxypyruvate reductase A [Rhizobiales bacterium]|nr:glyoxylate/hydroxypyruvate reductase A [Hyphomicrobiales bacterium]